MAEEGGSTGKIAVGLNIIMPILEKGSAVTLLLLLVIGGLTIFYQHKEMRRQQDNASKLYETLFAEKEKRVEAMSRLAICEGKPE